jgi:hypothetical protein
VRLSDLKFLCEFPVVLEELQIRRTIMPAGPGQIIGREFMASVTETGTTVNIKETRAGECGLPLPQ